MASDFTPGKPLTSKSGTLAYLAPEVYKGTGYSNGADWWSLGVLFYECIYNKVCASGDLTAGYSDQCIATIRRQHTNVTCCTDHESKTSVSSYCAARIDIMSARDQLSP